MDTNQLLKGYGHYMRRKGCMDGTIVTYMRILRRLERDTGVPLIEVDRDAMEALLEELGLNPATYRMYVSVWHNFFKWAVMEEIIERDPTARIVLPRLRQRLPRPILTDDLAKALANADSKMKAVLLCAAYQGMRCIEIAGLRREDVLFDDGLLRVVKGKGMKERLLPLHPQLAEAFQRYRLPASGPVFMRIRGTPYPPNQMSQYVAEYLHGIGVDATAHQLRHWFATKLYAVSHDIRLTQEMMGHADIKVTAIYTAFDRSAAKVSVDQISV